MPKIGILLALVLSALALAAPLYGAGGWDVLRFWLPPERIADRLRTTYGATKEPECKLLEPNDPLKVVTCDWDTENDRLLVFGMRPTNLTFFYYKNRLYTIQFDFELQQKHVLPWCEDLRGYLLEEYGPPQYENTIAPKTPGGLRLHSTTWDKGRVEISLMCMWRTDSTPNKMPPVELSYEDRDLTDELNAAGRKAKQQKHKR
jgi:hypothetical protein